MTGSGPVPPRVLRVDLSSLAEERLRTEPWRDADPALERVGSWSGAALGLALVVRALRERPTAPAPLVFTVGECVRRGVPTAVRTSIASASPMDGLYTEGQVGGDLALGLAGVADALVLTGRTELAGAVLEVGAERVALRSLPALAGLSPRAAWDHLEAEFGAVPAVRVGPAGERGVPFASLAVGGATANYVGRSGLGCVLGRLGLKAVVVTAPPLEPHPDAELLRALSSSPRLEARSTSGTFELWHAFAARGDLRARNYAQPVSADEGARLSRAAADSAQERSGCRGCPTPCGWVFEGARGGRQRGTFSATYALGPNVGLDDFDDALALLERCDAAGVDAVETGAGLALLCRARELARRDGGPEWGDRAALADAIDALGEGRGDGRLLALGAASLAAELGLEAESRGGPAGAARPEGDLAALLAQCVSAAGVDPMRTFPFLTDAGGAGGGVAGTLETLVGARLEPGALDPTDPTGKGRVVFAYENWKAAVDTTGFCAFSAAGLLADGVCELDRLGGWIEPRALRAPDAWSAMPAGRALLAAGASVVLLRRELNRMLGAAADRDRPAWARDRLALPGMLDEYLAARGLDGAGRPRAEALARLGGPELAEPVESPPAGKAAGAPPVAAGAPGGEGRGRVMLRSAGPLTAALGADPAVEVALPATVRDVLTAASRSKPDAARYLLRGDRAVPAVYRAGRRLAEGDAVRGGDVLDLVVAIRGG